MDRPPLDKGTLNAGVKFHTIPARGLQDAIDLGGGRDDPQVSTTRGETLLRLDQFVEDGGPEPFSLRKVDNHARRYFVRDAGQPSVQPSPIILFVEWFFDSKNTRVGRDRFRTFHGHLPVCTCFLLGKAKCEPKDRGK